MSEQFLDRADVVVGLQEMGSEGVAEGVGSDTLGKFGPLNCLVQRCLHILFMKMIPPIFLCVLKEGQSPLR